jgi:opacity protein-like surface antigen
MRRNPFVLPVVAFGALMAGTHAHADWSGAYLGGSLGGVKAKSDTRMTVANAGDYFTPGDPEQIAAMGAGGLSQGQLSGGVQGGYLWQSGNLVLGVEASASLLSFEQERSVSEVVVTSPAALFSIRQSISADWMASVRPRIGWAQSDWLVYLTAGLAVTRVKMDIAYDDTTPWSGRARGSASSTELGWVVGAGAEFALDGNWSLRGEYLYADFGRVSTTTIVTETFGGDPGYLRHGADLRTHSLQVGVSYRF